MRTRIPQLLAVLATLALSSCRSGDDGDESAAPPDTSSPAPTLEEHQLGAAPNVHAFGDILFAGQPSAEDFEAAREQGVRTVLNIRTAAELEKLPFDESEVVSELGMTYVHMPWNGAEELTDEVFDRTRELLEDAPRPLLFHCASANRVGATWIPWRVLDGGVDLEQAILEARTIGLRSEPYEAKARDYVRRRGE